MSNEWLDLPYIWDVAGALDKGWEIEFQIDPGNDKYCQWLAWRGNDWRKNYLYRGRPAQPKKVTVTSECWRSDDGCLDWAEAEKDFIGEGWKRFPAGDITGEIVQ
jgi:hypothetical protein